MIPEGRLAFEQPVWLLLLLAIVPTLLLALWARGGQSRARLVTSFTLRTLVILALSMAMARPSWVRTGEGVTVTVLLDRSQSVPLPLKRESERFLQEATRAGRGDRDRTAVITLARDSAIAALASPVADVEASAEPADLTATNLAGAVRLALATMPRDTANRIVLASDGNETMDSVLAAAEVARANEVPVDYLLLEYDYENEVVFEEIVMPARARVGQTARLRMVVRSQTETTGTVRLRRNGVAVDLDPDAPGDGMRVTLDPGLNALERLVNLGSAGPQRFEASFVADEEADDRIDRNNTAVGVVFVGGEGRILVLDDTGGLESESLRQALEESGFELDLRAPADWGDAGLPFLAAYDAVVMTNMPLYAFQRGHDDMLHAYVHDLGGGLVMIGGDRSFGAGGWIDSETAKTLPVELNPPQTREMPAGALALIMHSCEMPQANYWGQVVAESAIDALSRLDYCGIVEFTWGGGAATIEGNGWAYPMQQLGDKRAAIDATRTMTVGDMPSFEPAFALAYNGLMSVPAAQRHTIVISDGDPSPPLPGTLAKYKDQGITITTVMVGGHGTAQDRLSMQDIADQTGGTFYQADDPSQLPQIFFKEATLVSRSLIQDGRTFPTQVRSGLPGPVMGFSAVPPTEGYVLTVAREGLAQTPIVVQSEQGDDPFLAHWNYGLGRSVAFTGDATGRWGAPWVSWGEFRAFWEQTVRWAMRPSSPTDLSITTRVDGETAIVELEALDAEAGAINFLRPSAVVMRPDATAEPLTLAQVGPGRYRGRFPLGESGAYLVNVQHESPGLDGRVQRGTVQAAVTVPYPREFRDLSHNEALLRTLAERTGGRRIEASDPAIAELFERATLPRPQAPHPIWDVLAIVAASLLLLDVASRRLSLDTGALRARLQAAFGRREEASTATLAAFQRTRSGVGGRTAAGDPGVVRRASDPASGASDARFVAGEDDARMDLEETATGTAPSPGAPAGDRARPPAPAEDDDDGDHTSRLLAAKRRARRDGGGDGGDGGGGGGGS